MRRLLSFFLRSRLAFVTCEFGQTLMAAKGCGRRYLGIEREQKYIQIVLHGSMTSLIDRRGCKPTLRSNEGGSYG
jgi:hypothetical protein